MYDVTVQLFNCKLGLQVTRDICEMKCKCDVISSSTHGPLPIDCWCDRFIVVAAVFSWTMRGRRGRRRQRTRRSSPTSLPRTTPSRWRTTLTRRRRTTTPQVSDGCHSVNCVWGGGHSVHCVWGGGSLGALRVGGGSLGALCVGERVHSVHCVGGHSVHCLGGHWQQGAARCECVFISMRIVGKLYDANLGKVVLNFF